VPTGASQTAPDDPASRRLAVSGFAVCNEVPQDDALVSTCAPATLAERGEIVAVPVAAQPTANIALAIPTGTPIRIALDQRTPVDHPGELVHGRLSKRCMPSINRSFLREALRPVALSRLLELPP